MLQFNTNSELTSKLLQCNFIVTNFTNKVTSVHFLTHTLLLKCMYTDSPKKHSICYSSEINPCIIYIVLVHTFGRPTCSNVRIHQLKLSVCLKCKPLAYNIALVMLLRKCTHINNTTHTYVKHQQSIYQYDDCHITAIYIIHCILKTTTVIFIHGTSLGLCHRSSSEVKYLEHKSALNDPV